MIIIGNYYYYWWLFVIIDNYYRSKINLSSNHDQVTISVLNFFYYKISQV